jgi:hypothetical protein
MASSAFYWTFASACRKKAYTFFAGIAEIGIALARPMFAASRTDYDPDRGVRRCLLSRAPIMARISARSKAATLANRIFRVIGR